MQPPTAFLRYLTRILAWIPSSLIVFSSTGLAATLTWDGGGSDSLISNGINWTTNTSPGAGDSLVFAGSLRLDPTLNSNLTVAGLSFASGASAFTLGGGAVYKIGTGGIVNNSTSLQTIANQIALSASQSWNAVSGNLMVTGAVDLGNKASRTLTITGAQNTSLTNILSGAGKLTKTGTGVLTLSAANTYAGLTNLSAGTLVVGNNNAVGSGTLQLGSATMRNSGTALSFTNALTLAGDTNFDGTGALTFTGATGLTGARILTVTNGAVSLNGLISDSGTAVKSLTKAGAGTLILGGSSANTFTGSLKVNDGTLNLSKSSGQAFAGTVVGIGDGIGTVNSAVLRRTASGQMPSTTAITLDYDGLFDLQGFNSTISTLTTFGGSVTGSGASLILGGDVTATAGGSNVTTVGTPLVLNASRAFTINDNAVAGDADLSANGVISDGSTASGLTKLGNGTLLLGAANTYTGLTTVSAGTLAYNVNNAVGSGGVSVLGAILDLRAGFTDTVGQVILDSGGQITGTGSAALSSTLNYDLRSGSVAIPLGGIVGLTKTGTGTVSIGGLNTYTGATAISGGTLLSLRANSLPATSAVTVGSGAVLALNNFDNNIGDLTGSGSVTLGSGNLTAGNGGTSTTATTFSGIISGTGGLTKTGSGTLILSGANTFTGATTINQGILRLGASNVIADTSPVSLNVAAGASFDLNNFNENIGSLAGGGSVLLGTATVTAGTNSSSTVFSGVVSGSGSLSKTGSGTLTLTGANTYSGVTTVSQGILSLSGSAGTLSSTSSIVLASGTGLMLDNSAAENANRLPDAAAVSLSGATLTLRSDANGSTETAGQLIPASGASTVLVQHLGTTDQITSLTFNGLGTVGSGATVNFNGTGGTLGVNTGGPHIFITGQSQGLLGGWATVGADFARYTPLGVAANTVYYTGDKGININDPAQIVQLTGSSLSPAFTLSATPPVNTGGVTTDLGLNLTDVPIVNLGTDSSLSLNLQGGGLVKSTTTATTISGAGSFTAGGTGTTGNLAISVTSGSTLTIASNITNNAAGGVVSLSKGDAGLLILSGTNTYTGGNFLNGGIVRIAAGVSLGNFSSPVTFGGGALEISTGFTANSARVFAVTASQSGVLDIAANQTLTLDASANRLTAGNASAVLTKSGEGALVVPGANAAFDGILRLAAGTLELRDASSLGDSTLRGQIQLNGGLLRLRQDTSTAFGNNVVVGEAATVDVDRSTGTSPAVSHTLGTLEIGDQTLTVSGANGAGLVFGNTLLTGSAVFNSTTAPLTLGAISGSAGFTKSGAGLLLLNGEGIYTGGTSINSGTLRLGVVNGVAPASSVNVLAGAVFDLNNFSTTVGSIGGAGNVTMGTGSLTAGGNGSSTTFSGIATGTGAFTKTGAGVLTVAGPQAWTGATTISAGTLRWGSANVLADPSTLTINQGATADLSIYSDVVASLAGAGQLALGAGSTLTAGVNNSTTAFSGIVSGSGNFVKGGTGVMTLSGNSSFTGLLTVQTGAIILDAAGSAGGAEGGTVVASGAEVRLGAGVVIAGEPLSLAGSGIASGGPLQVVSGSASWNGPITLTGAATLNPATGTGLILGGSVSLGSNLLTLSGAGAIVLRGAVSGSGGLTKTSSSILEVDGDNTYTGATNINAGTLLLGGAERLPDTTAVTVASGATFDLADQGETIGSLAGAGNVQTGPGAASLLKFGANNTSTLFTGNILGTGSIEKIGTGTWSVSESQGFTGGTTVSSGTLEVSGNGSLAASTSFDITGGTLLLSGTNANRLGNTATIDLGGGAGATIRLSGVIAETAGVFTLGGASVIDFGTGSGTLNFAASDKEIWAGSLAVWNWSGSTSGGGTDQLSFGSNGNGLTSSQVAAIEFFSGAGVGSLGSAQILNSGEVVPSLAAVPEPAALLSAGLLFFTLGCRELGRRRPAA